MLVVASPLTSHDRFCFSCRPEVKLGGLQELLARINTDIGIARSQLDLPQWQPYRQQLADEVPPPA